MKVAGAFIRDAILGFIPSGFKTNEQTVFTGALLHSTGSQPGF